ncbi:hypothetical protein D9758_005653 [Tetrapyrgos nigripes]|uniref:Uncharacterized protein n=1 Tax=Tetrapyrgos nigripes TaxID=182062 RepID=A0A8H5GGM3_9AGAR|nr:hypothetical protein D9758_018471 [Tetrapyrgos nigripes]KAF5364633.1 hypothetical protein D9758_005653 [Tetrapyrgos nigripes]
MLQPKVFLRLRSGDHAELGHLGKSFEIYNRICFEAAFGSLNQILRQLHQAVGRRSHKESRSLSQSTTYLYSCCTYQLSPPNQPDDHRSDM